MVSKVGPRTPFLDRLHHPEELALRVEEAADCVKSVTVAHPEASVAEPLEASVEVLEAVWAALRAMSALVSAERLGAASDHERSLRGVLGRLGALVETLGMRSDGVGRTMDEQLRELARASALEAHEERTLRLRSVAQVVRETAESLKGEAANLTGAVGDHRRELDRARDRLAEAHEAALLNGLPGVVAREDFERRLARLLSRPAMVRGSLCVALVAVDRLGEISASLSAFTGDALFFQVGRLVQAMASEQAEAVVGLYREWELGIVLPSCTLGKGRQIVEDLRARVQRTAWECKAGSHKEVITVTISSALTQPCYGESVQSLKARLEELLAQARSSGGNDLVVSR